MAQAIVNLFFGSLGLVVLFGYAWMVFMGVFIPIWMTLLLRRLTRIAGALENNSGFSERATHQEADAEQRQRVPVRNQDLGHQLLR